MNTNANSAVAPVAMREHGGLGARHRVAIVALITLLAAVLYYPTALSLKAQWEDLDNLAYTHGYLILAVCAFLIFRARTAIREAALQSWSPPAAISTAVLSFVWLLMYRAGIELAHQVLLPLIAWSAIYAALGRAVALRVAFPFAYFYFAIPIWSVGNEVLQDLTVHAVRLLIAVFGLTAYVVDNFVHIPSGSFEIAGGCSGLHFFVVALAIAALYGEIHRDSWKNRILLLVLAGALAALSNWIRVFWIIVAGYNSQMQHPLITEGHYYFGWKIFAGTMVVFFLLARRLPLSADTSARTPETDATRPSFALGVGIAAAVAAIGPVWAAITAPPDISNVRLSVSDMQKGEWVAESRASGWTPTLQGADATAQRGYRAADGGRVDMFVAVYLWQKQGKELHGYGNSVVGDLHARIEAQEVIEREGTPINELVLEDAAGAQQLIWYYYEIGSTRTASGLGQQFLYAAQSLTSAPTSKIVGMRSACANDCAAARVRLANFLRSAPTVQPIVGD